MRSSLCLLPMKEMKTVSLLSLSKDRFDENLFYTASSRIYMAMHQVLMHI